MSGHVGIDRLVVATPVPTAFTQRRCRSDRRSSTRDAQHAVGAEAQRIEEVVIDAAVDHVHAPQAAVVRM
jgi:hypothetical protein